MGKINVKLLPLKFLLFFLFAALGCLPAFLTIHMYHIGLSHEEVTWINTILPITALIGPPTVGYLADRFGHYRFVTVVSMFLAGVFHTSLLFVPEISPTFRPELKLVCTSQGSSLLRQSCSESCSDISDLSEIRFRISHCYHECDNNLSQVCISMNSTESSEKKSMSKNTFKLLDEASLHEYIMPTICFQNKSSYSQCKHLNNDNFIEIKIEELNHKNSSATFPLNYSEEYSCCEYTFKDYSTISGHYNKFTCVSQPGCHVVCDINEYSNTSSLLQAPVCAANKDSNPRLTFWLYFCLRAMADMFPAILISLFDAVVLAMVSQHGGDYGRQKMFGLFAVGTSAPIVGYLMDSKIGVHGSLTYSPVFYTFDLLLILTGIITFFLPLEVKTQRSSMLRNMANLIRTYEFNLLVVIVILLGAFNGYLETFLYIYLSENLGASSFLLGMTITVGIFPSVPFLYKSDSIIKYCGHHYLLMLAFVGYCVRFAGLSYIKNPLWVVPLEVLELFTINLMQIAAVTLAYKIAPKQLLATAQGLVWISHFGIGRALGTIVGGYLIKIYGMISVFQMASVFSASCGGFYFLLHQIFQCLQKKRRRNMLPKEDTKMNGDLANGIEVHIPLQSSDEN